MKNVANEIGLDFNRSTGLHLKSKVFGSNETTFRIGGEFEYFLEPNSFQDLAIALQWIKQRAYGFNILGAGSNLLVSSGGVRGWTLRLGKAFRFLEKLSEDRFRVGAAYSLMSLSRELSQSAFSGLEFAAGIPGSLGGALKMNAGAHLGEMSSIVSAIEVIDSDGNTHKLMAADLNFKYRSCSLPPDFIVTSVEIKLAAGDQSKIMTNLTHNLEYRKKTQPLSMPSAGSIFRNPGKGKDISAGAIIEKLGLKGRSQGQAEISSLHANWIVNPSKKALSSDVVSLIEVCKSEAEKQLSLTLQTEVVMW